MACLSSVPAPPPTPGAPTPLDSGLSSFCMKATSTARRSDPQHTVRNIRPTKEERMYEIRKKFEILNAKGVCVFFFFVPQAPSLVLTYTTNIQ